MDAIANRQRHLHAGLISVVAAVSAVSVATVVYQGTSAGTYAFLGVGLMGLLLLSSLVYLQPLKTFLIALVFLTSPLALVLSLQWSALISAFLLGGASLGFAIRTPVRDFAKDRLFLPIGILLAWSIFSAAYGLSLGNEISYLLGDFFQVIEFALVYFLVVQLLRDETRIRQTLKVLLSSILVTIVVELLLFAIGTSAGDLLPSWSGTSTTELLVRTIDIDATILFAVLINLYPIARSKRQRFWLWMALLPTIANIALSLSRGLWLCSLVAVVASIVLQSREVRKGQLKAFALVSICGLLLAGTWRMGSDSDGSLLGVLEERVFHGVDQVQEGFAGTESMATRRFLEMVIVGPQVLAQPWIGHGLGATYVIGGFAVLDAGTEGLIDHHFIHNLYLVTAFRMGGIGLAFLLWVLFRYFRITLGAYRKMPLDVSKALIAGFVVGVIGQLFLSFTQPTIIDHPTCALIACAMGLSLRLVPANPSSQPGMELKSGV